MSEMLGMDVCGKLKECLKGVKSSRQSQPVFESAYPPIADKNFGESDFAILMSAFPW